MSYMRHLKTPRLKINLSTLDFRKKIDYLLQFEANLGNLVPGYPLQPNKIDGTVSRKREKTKYYLMTLWVKAPVS